MPNGYGWIVKQFEMTKRPIIGVIAPKTMQVILDLPNNIRFFTRVTVVDRNKYRLFLKRHNDNTHAFVNMPNGICYSGYFK